MNLLTPAALFLSLLAVPLVVLYMLRTRRHRHEVSSVMLWEKAGVAVTSAVPWQKPKLTSLLVLQLLVLALFVFLLARPFGKEESVLGPHTVFVMDTSGSMALDGRLDAAKKRALELINDASETNVISIVEAGPRPRILAALARDPAELRSAITGLVSGGGLENLEGAIDLANGLATPDRATKILIFSDGGLPDLAPVSEPVIGAEHLIFDATPDNVAITAFSGEGTADGRVRLFFEVTNYGTTDRDVVVSVTAGAQPPQTVPVTVAAGGRVRDGLRVESAPDLAVAAALLDDEGTPLADGNLLDDSAYLVFGTGSTTGVAVIGPGSVFLDALVGSIAEFIPAAGDAPDVLIVDGDDASQLTAPAWLLRPSTPPPGTTITGTVQNTAASYQRPGDPLLADVDLSELLIAEADVVDAPGWLPLVKAGDVPLVLLGEVDGRRVVYFTFDLTQSNLPVQIGFPILGARVLRYLGGQDLASLLPGPAGQPLALAPPPGYTTSVEMPSGSTRQLPASIGLFEDTTVPGIYRVSYESEAGDSRLGPVAVRQFVAAESVGSSRVIATEPLALAQAESTAIISEWTLPILLALLSLLLIEWWVGLGAPRPHLRRGTGGRAT